MVQRRMNVQFLALPLLLLIAAWLQPKHELPWPAFHSDLCAAAGLTMAWLSWLRQRGAGGAIEVPRLALAILVVAMVPLLQAGAGLIHYAGDALMAALYLLGFGFAVLLGAQLGAHPSIAERHWHRMTAAVLLACLLCVGMAGAQWWGLDLPGTWLLRMTQYSRPFANLAQPNLLASLLVLGLIAALALRQSRHIGWTCLALCTACLVSGVAMTGSRVARVELLVLAGWLLLMRSRTGLRAGRFELIGLSGLGFAMLCLWPLLAQAPRLGRAVDTAPLMLAGVRGLHWQAMFDAIQRSPWFGYGWNQVAVAQSRVALDHPASHEFIEHSHNLPIDLLVWNGAPLGGLLIAGLGLWLWRQWRACRSPGAALLLGAVLTLLTHAMTEYPLEYFFFLLPLGLMMGGLEAVAPVGSPQPLPRWAILSAMVPSIGLLVAVALEYPNHERAHRAMRETLSAGQPWETAPPAAARPMRLLNQLEVLPTWMSAMPQAPLSNGELEELKRATERFGYAPLLLQRARALCLSGDAEAAAASLALLCRLHGPKDCQAAITPFKLGVSPCRSAG
ncbi:MAG: O-antigen ligase family protein [Burkholderiaceae bacterium]|nr:O-antigen ligase family protein [Burkholderiaceae bacterium]